MAVRGGGGRYSELLRVEAAALAPLALSCRFPYLSALVTVHLIVRESGGVFNLETAFVVARTSPLVVA